MIIGMALKMILTDIFAMCGVLRVLQSARKDYPKHKSGIINMLDCQPDIIASGVLCSEDKQACSM